MNQLNTERRTQVVKALCEGNSIRSTARMTGVAINTVVKLLTELGSACLDYQDATLRSLPCTELQCDEIWSFVYAKEKNVPADHQGEFGYGDVWTFTAIDSTTKLVPCWMVGQRNGLFAEDFMRNLASRLSNRVQLTTDGHRMYLKAVDDAFGADIDYGMLVKHYEGEEHREKRYSPAKFVSATKEVIQGDPDKAKISTSYVERNNLTMRMSMRRFTRLTNGFSKKLENHIYAISLHFMHYNFCRTHKSLANPYARTPAMAAGVTDHIWTVEELIGLLDKSN